MFKIVLATVLLAFFSVEGRSTPLSTLAWNSTDGTTKVSTDHSTTSWTHIVPSGTALITQHQLGINLLFSNNKVN